MGVDTWKVFEDDDGEISPNGWLVTVGGLLGVRPEKPIKDAQEEPQKEQKEESQPTE